MHAMFSSSTTKQFVEVVLNFIVEAQVYLKEEDAIKYKNNPHTILNIIQAIHECLKEHQPQDQPDASLLDSCKNRIEKILKDIQLDPPICNMKITLNDPRILAIVKKKEIEAKESFQRYLQEQEEKEKQTTVQNPTILSLKQVYEQLRHVLIGKQDIDSCAIPKKCLVPLFAYSQRGAISARLASMSSIRYEDKPHFHQERSDLVDFIEQSISLPDFNLEVAKLICWYMTCDKQQPLLTSAHSLQLFFKEKNLSLDEHSKKEQDLANKYITKAETLLLRLTKILDEGKSQTSEAVTKRMHLLNN